MDKGAWESRWVTFIRDAGGIIGGSLSCKPETDVNPLAGQEVLTDIYSPTFLQARDTERRKEGNLIPCAALPFISTQEKILKNFLSLQIQNAGRDLGNFYIHNLWSS